MRSFESGIQGGELEIQGVESGIQREKFGIQGVELGIQEVELGIIMRENKVIYFRLIQTGSKL